ncbi:hypothetical protein ACFVS2_20630 [Brevibacillus sp. NPDC058079]|uniref:hypothetical protein n=1 Tax=Brevibacillus sp. NPDC058079 TaxID=3346330 RepID=UPI0036F03674
MEFIIKKLQHLSVGEHWIYGNGFSVYRVNAGWTIYKKGVHVITTSSIHDIAKEIKLTFIAIEVTNAVMSN